jgi:hypothetical protein
MGGPSQVDDFGGSGWDSVDGLDGDLDRAVVFLKASAPELISPRMTMPGSGMDWPSW